jgi:DNA-binding CsgD family transcriptional regulator
MVLILDADDRVLAADAGARQRLKLLPTQAPNHVPGIIAYLSARARWDATAGSASARYGLSVRERQIAALLAQGESAKAIASTLTISPWTAQDHIKAIYRKTGVGARSDLTSLAAGAGAV